MSRVMTMLRVSTTVHMIFLLIAISSAGGKELFDASRVAQDEYNRYDGDDEISSFDVTLINHSGEKRHRGLVRWKRRLSELDEILMRVSAPGDIRGTTVLTLQRDDVDDKQFLYLPAMKKIRRISTADRTQRFVGMDWNYEDLRRVDVKDWTYKALRMDTYGGFECYVYEAIPKSDDLSVYGKMIHWIRRDNYYRVKAEQYDKRMKLWKITEAPHIEKIQGVWTAILAIAEDFKARHKTLFARKWVNYNTGVPVGKFTIRALDEKEFLGE